MTAEEQGRQALDAALADGIVSTVFQPLWAVTGRCWGFEALTRFANGASPEVVWTLAQMRGMAVALDRIALRVAVGAGRELPYRLFLNISVTHLADARTLPRWGSPDRVVWEVTEGGPLTEAERQGAQWLRAQGYTIAMDDAGAGDATAHRLHRLRPHLVKLDRTVVQHWHKGRREMLRGWVRAARAAAAGVVAEGIEDVRWIATLAAEGVEAVQGYAVGRPAPAERWGRVPANFWGGGGKSYHLPRVSGPPCWGRAAAGTHGGLRSRGQILCPRVA